MCVCVRARARARACTKSLQSCPTLCNPLDYSPPGFSVHGFSRQEYTKVGCHALLQGIFLTQGSNPPLLCLLDWQVGSLSLTPPGKPINIHTYVYVIYMETETCGFSPVPSITHGIYEVIHICIAYPQWPWSIVDNYYVKRWKHKDVIWREIEIRGSTGYRERSWKIELENVSGKTSETKSADDPSLSKSN